MKNYLVLTLIFLSSNLFANEVTQSQEQNCRGAMAMAEAAMTLRQNGVKLPTVLENNEKMLTSGKSTPKEASLMKMIVRDAYSKPKYTTEDYKQESINEFSANYYLACMEGYEAINQ